MKRGEPSPEGSEGIAARFNRCECARLLGMEVTGTWPGGARVVMDPEGKRNPNGVLHGGAIFSLADHAFGLAANTGEIPQVAVSATITYLSPAKGRLEAVAYRIAETGTHSLFNVRVYEGKRLVAILEGIGIREEEKQDG
ncbi:MAG: PaaI family thioesterase [Methanoregulaceae archaeon]|nr:PaaI family thioesterase [Methanoregulaceae archaeon]